MSKKNENFMLLKAYSFAAQKTCIASKPCLSNDSLRIQPIRIGLVINP